MTSVTNLITKKIYYGAYDYLPAWSPIVLSGAVSAQHPTRQLLGGPLGYVPQGCSGLILSVNAEESDASWFQQAPEIRGTVTLSNPNTYDIPVSSVVIQARSSEGLLYSATANCNGAASTAVPANPQPYQYGTATCRFCLVLDPTCLWQLWKHCFRRR